jgi:energy-coupling factor transporter ATP-binding protein EcfA2
VYNAFRNKEHGLHLPVLTKEDFEKKYGPKPWVLINEMMAGAGLSYRVNNPEGQERDDDFHLQLSDVDRNIEVQVKDLSTGERVLMSLALAIYNTNEDSMRPDILLLDEPDAALHPEFSKVLLKSINESIVQKAGVKVVISTHSPTTVALSEESWLYQMEYGQYPHKVTKKQALNILLKDLEPLRVSVENRRQVFVESRNDVGYYENIFPLLPKNGVIVPQFLPACTKIGSNCQDVIEIVKALHDRGNDLVYGIIDYDNHNSNEDNIFVLGEGNRYAIDNYVLDPLYVALLLIRDKKDTFEDVEQNIKFSSLHNAPDALLQGIINSVFPANVNFRITA